MFQEPGSASLRERISEARRESADGLAWEMDREQVLPVVEKLARGHVAYEEYPRLAGPTSISIHPLACMSELERREFEDGAGCGRLFPELGSLALARVSKEAFEDSWVEVQTGRYRYSFSVFDTHLSVRIVVREYLACEAIWDCA
ncbi:hypothetical protein [Leucobacter sp. VD1]|uniref:hypothetical protein n=1 Tax=Leucobacter sp. VD1 TaxID=3080381 RepID=UPI003017EB41